MPTRRPRDRPVRLNHSKVHRHAFYNNYSEASCKCIKVVLIAQDTGLSEEEIRQYSFCNDLGVKFVAGTQEWYDEQRLNTALWLPPFEAINDHVIKENSEYEGSYNLSNLWLYKDRKGNIIDKPILATEWIERRIYEKNLQHLLMHDFCRDVKKALSEENVVISQRGMDQMREDFRSEGDELIRCADPPRRVGLQISPILSLEAVIDAHVKRCQLPQKLGEEGYDQFEADQYVNEEDRYMCTRQKEDIDYAPKEDADDDDDVEVLDNSYGQGGGGFGVTQTGSTAFAEYTRLFGGSVARPEDPGLEAGGADPFEADFFNLGQGSVHVGQAGSSGVDVDQAGTADLGPGGFVNSQGEEDRFHLPGQGGGVGQFGNDVDGRGGGGQSAAGGFVPSQGGGDPFQPPGKGQFGGGGQSAALGPGGFVPSQGGGDPFQPPGHGQFGNDGREGFAAVQARGDPYQLLGQEGSIGQFGPGIDSMSSRGFPNAHMGGGSIVRAQGRGVNDFLHQVHHEGRMDRNGVVDKNARVLLAVVNNLTETTQRTLGEMSQKVSQTTEHALAQMGQAVGQLGQSFTQENTRITEQGRLQNEATLQAWAGRGPIGPTSAMIPRDATHVPFGAGNPHSHRGVNIGNYDRPVQNMNHPDVAPDYLRQGQYPPRPTQDMYHSGVMHSYPPSQGNPGGSWDNSFANAGVRARNMPNPLIAHSYGVPGYSTAAPSQGAPGYFGHYPHGNSATSAEGGPNVMGRAGSFPQNSERAAMTDVSNEWDSVRSSQPKNQGY